MGFDRIFLALPFFMYFQRCFFLLIPLLTKPFPCNLDTMLSYCVNGRMGQPTTSTSVNVIYRLEPMQCDTVSSDLLLNCPTCTYIQCRVMENSKRTVAGIHDIFVNSTNANTNYKCIPLHCCGTIQLMPLTCFDNPHPFLQQQPSLCPPAAPPCLFLTQERSCPCQGICCHQIIQSGAENMIPRPHIFSFSLSFSRLLSPTANIYLFADFIMMCRGFYSSLYLSTCLYLYLSVELHPCVFRRQPCC